MQSAATDWATEIPVRATENPVTLTVTAQTLALRRLPEPPFRAFSKEILEDLTTRWGRYMVCAVLCQNQRPRACVIFVREIAREFCGHSAEQNGAIFPLHTSLIAVR